MKKKCVLVTGGTGFIGSHTVVELLQAGYKVVIVDNFYNSKPEVLKSLKKITGKKFDFEEGDVANKRFMNSVFKKYDIDAVIHFAGYKAVGESVAKPLMYYRNNLDSTLTLLECMKKYNVRNLVFSSSATVYAADNEMPLTEKGHLGTSNPYGETKLMIEKILDDTAAADPEFSFIKLRYFNPIGAHESGLLGEDPNGIPNNLMPYIVKVATGKLDCLHIFGNDYDTKDGTGIRDYIHVVDLAKAHLLAIEYSFNHKGSEAINVGTGKGTSVLQLVKAFEKANNLKLNYEFTGRRPGDLPRLWADTKYAKKALGFKAEKSIEDMCRDAYRYEVNQTKSAG